MRTRTATFPTSFVRSPRRVRIDRQITFDRQIIIDLLIRGITYLTFGMAVSSVWSGGRSMISFFHTYVLPVYQNM